MRWLCYIGLAISMVACREDKSEVVDLNDVLPESKNYREGEYGDSSSTTIAYYQPRIPADLLSTYHLQIDSAVTSDSLLFPDRFAPLAVEKFDYRSGQNQVSYNSWTFKDSIHSRNVFLNWMNCFGKSCKSVRIGAQQSMQSVGFLLLLNDTSLVYIYSNSGAELTNWKKLYTSDKRASHKYVLQQNRKGKVQWWTCNEGVLTKVPEPVIIDEP